MPVTRPSAKMTQRPTVDEWGVYDPQQAGLAALFMRLASSTSSPARSGGEPRAPKPVIGVAFDDHDDGNTAA